MKLNEANIFQQKLKGPINISDQLIRNSYEAKSIKDFSISVNVFLSINKGWQLD